MRVFKFLTICLLLALAAPLVPHTAAPAAAQATSPVFEPSDCPVTFPSRYLVECGTVTAPLEYAQPDGPTIRLAVAVFRTPYRNPRPGPVIFLSGGPGSNTLDSFAGGLGSTLDALLRQRDVILLDQRGMGYSEPNLSCPETGEDTATPVDDCRARLEGQGVKLSAFNTVESAGDVDAVRRALGYDQVTIVTGSYGTTLAMTVMRHHPASVRAAVLVSSAPPEVDLLPGLITGFQEAIDAFFAACAADPQCSTQYPDLERVFYVLFEQAADPGVMTITNPQTGQPENIPMDGPRLVSGVRAVLYDPGLIPQLPGLIYALYARDYEPVIPLAASLMNSTSVLGAFLSMRCADDVLTTTPEAFAAAVESVNPALRSALEGEGADYFEQCAAWNAAALDPVEQTPVTGDVPALFLNGLFDPASRPEWATNAAAHLTTAYTVVFPTLGHFILDTRPCAQLIIEAFVRDPNTAPETACADG